MKPSLLVDRLELDRQGLVFYVDLDALARNVEGYKAIWENIELTLIRFLYTWKKHKKSSYDEIDAFYIWAELGPLINLEEHICNACIIYVVPKGILLPEFDEESLTVLSKGGFWSFGEYSFLNEDCYPLFYYENGNIFRYVFNLPTAVDSKETEEELACWMIDFLDWDEEIHAVWSNYSIPGDYEVSLNKLLEKVDKNREIEILYRKYTLDR